MQTEDGAFVKFLVPVKDIATVIFDMLPVYHPVYNILDWTSEFYLVRGLQNCKQWTQNDEYLWEFLLCFHKNLNFFILFRLACEELKDMLLRGWSTDHLEHGISTTYINMSVSHKKIFPQKRWWLWCYLTLSLGSTSKIVLAFQTWVFVSVLHYITAQEVTSQDDSLLLKNMAVTVWVRTNLYTPDCMMCPVA